MNISPTSKKFKIVPEKVVTFDDLKNLVLTLILGDGIVIDESGINQIAGILPMLKQVPVLTQEQILQRQVALQNEISGLSKLMPATDSELGSSGEGKPVSATEVVGKSEQEVTAEERKPADAVGDSDAADATESSSSNKVV